MQTSELLSANAPRKALSSILPWHDGSGAFGAALVRVSEAGPLEKAAAAHVRGDYVTAIKLLDRLPSGNAAAQTNVGLMYATGQEFTGTTLSSKVGSVKLLSKAYLRHSAILGSCISMAEVSSGSCPGGDRFRRAAVQGQRGTAQRRRRV